MKNNSLIINVTHNHTSIVSLSSVKELLNSFNIKEENIPTSILKYTYLMFPLSINVKKLFYNSNLSLTELIPPDQRIRYRLNNVIDKNYIAIISYINNNHESKIKINIKTKTNLDSLSLRFYELAKLISDWDINIIYDNLIENNYSNIEDLKLKNIISEFKRNKDDKSKYYELINIAFDYINAGDALTASNIGHILKAYYQDKYIWNLLSISELILGNNIQSEYYSDRWVDADENLFKIDSTRALYSKAMLYIRLHSKELIDIEKSKKLLNEAYQLMLENSINNNDEKLAFEKIFNRNGYALVLFKEGKVLDAKNQIKECLENIYKFNDNSDKIKIHKSVLLYNLSQCYEKLEIYDKAIETYNILLNLDPNMDEYYLDLSKVYAKINAYDKAIDVCVKASIIEPYNHQNWAMLAYWQNIIENYKESSNNYLKAYNICPNPLEKLKYINNFSFNYLLRNDVNDYDKLIEIVEYNIKLNLENKEDSEDEIVRGYSILAEIYLKHEKYELAKKSIYKGLSEFKENLILKENYKILETI